MSSERECARAGWEASQFIEEWLKEEWAAEGGLAMILESLDTLADCDVDVGHAQIQLDQALMDPDMESTRFAVVEAQETVKKAFRRE